MRRLLAESEESQDHSEESSWCLASGIGYHLTDSDCVIIETEVSKHFVALVFLCSVLWMMIRDHDRFVTLIIH